LFLEREKTPNTGKLFKNNIVHLVCIYVIWVLLYVVDYLGIHTSLANPKLIFTTARTLRKFHLWFLPNMIGIYAIVPLLYKLKSYKNGNYIKYGCIGLLVFILAKTVTIGLSLWGCPIIPNNWYLDYLGYVGYFLTGYYLTTLDTSRIKKRYLFLAYILVIVLTAFLNAAYSISVGMPTELLYNYFCIPTYAEAVLIFLMFQNMKEPVFFKKWKTVIRYISECTLGIYLLHVYVMDTLSVGYGIHTKAFGPVEGVLIVSVIVFAICLAVIAILKKIPIVKKWVV